MIPLRDDQPSNTFSFVTLVLIAINAWVFFAWQIRVGIDESVMHAALVPAKFTHAATPAAFAPMLASMFMHGSIMHIVGNMWFLWIFGDNVEDAMVHFR